MILLYVGQVFFNQRIITKVVPIDKFSVVISMILAFVILKEDLTFKTVMGGILITAGTFVMIL